MPFATEVASVLIAVVPALILPASQATAAAIFGWTMLPLILLDYQHLWLPNRLVLLLAAVGLLVGPMLTTDVILLDRFVGLAVGFLGLEAIRLAYKKYRQRDGMGAGDPKLFGALGGWLGWQLLPMTLLIASIIGLVFASILHLTAKDHRTAYPFGSYLGLAAYLAVLMR